MKYLSWFMAILQKADILIWIFQKLSKNTRTDIAVRTMYGGIVVVSVVIILLIGYTAQVNGWMWNDDNYKKVDIIILYLMAFEGAGWLAKVIIKLDELEHNKKKLQASSEADSVAFLLRLVFSIIAGGAVTMLVFGGVFLIYIFIVVVIVIGIFASPLKIKIKKKQH